MGARFEAVAGLDEMVAQMVAPEVRKVALRVERRAKQTAPPAKRWVSMLDNDVRDTHQIAHGQVVPGNLRFQLEGREWDRQRGITAPDGNDYFYEPRDTSTGHTLETAQNAGPCRCQAALMPTAIAQAIKTERMSVYGTEIRVLVSCEFVQIVACEFGDSYPTRSGEIHEDGTRFMGKAAACVAATM